VSVAGTPPVATSLASTPAFLTSASAIRFEDEPGEENATVLPPVSLRLRMPLCARAYH
jgi:hypothetical protein